MAEQPQPTPTSPPDRPPPFDEAVFLRLKVAVDDVLLHHPEVRAVAAAVTWDGGLNEAQISHALWLGVDGIVQTPEDILNGIRQTLRLLEQQLDRGYKLANFLGDRIDVLRTEVEAKNEEIQRLERKLAELQPAEAQEEVEEGGGSPTG